MIQICRRNLLFSALVLAACLAFAQEAETPAGTRAPADAPLLIGPDRAVEAALEHNLDLEQTRLNNEAKRRAAATPWNVFIPTVELGSTLARLNKKPEAVVLPLPPPLGPVDMGGGGPQWRLSASLQMTLNINIGTFTGMKQTVEEYQAGLITVEKAKLQLERDVRKAYYNMLLAKEHITLLEESFANAERRAAMAGANYRAGLVPEVSMLQARVAMENMKPNLDEAKNAYRMAMASFAMFLGLPYNTAFELEPLSGNAEYAAFEAEDLISQAAANRPDIEELRRRLSALKAAKKSLFFNLYTPTLSLGFNMDPAFGGDPWKDNWFDGAKWNQQSGMFRVSLFWRLNALLPFTPEYQSYQAMKDGEKALNLGLAQAVQGTETEVYNIILQLEKTRTTAEAQKLTVELAERTLRLSETAYRNGLKELLEVQNDALALHQARLGVLQQNYNYLMGLLDLEYAIGVPFGSLGREEIK